MCVYCARKPAKRDINRRTRYFRCFGQRVPYYSVVSFYTVRMPMSVHNCRFSIRQVHRRVSASLEKTQLCFSQSRRISRLIFFSRNALSHEIRLLRPNFTLTLSSNCKILYTKFIEF